MSFFSKKPGDLKDIESPRHSSMGRLQQEKIWPQGTKRVNGTFYSPADTTPRTGVKNTCAREGMLPARIYNR